MCSGLVLRQGANGPAMADLLAARIALGRQALAANPASPTARSMLADSLIQADCPELALDLFRSDDSSGVHDLAGLTALARAQFVTRDLSAALRSLDAARACPGFGREQLLLRFEVLVAQGDISAARDMVADIQLLDPCNGIALKLLANSAFKQGDPNTVLAACDRILTSSPGETSALHYRMVLWSSWREASKKGTKDVARST
jgi:cytochrome c-type biogenesis protein CcmH/NrfG